MEEEEVVWSCTSCHCRGERSSEPSCPAWRGRCPGCPPRRPCSTLAGPPPPGPSSHGRALKHRLDSVTALGAQGVTGMADMMAKLGDSGHQVGAIQLLQRYSTIYDTVVQRLKAMFGVDQEQ